MLYVVLLGFISTLLIPIIIKLKKEYLGLILSILPLSIFLYFAWYYQAITNGQVFHESYQWFPSLGINLTFFLDGLSLTFALIISFVGFIVFYYASSYLKENKFIGRFYVYILVYSTLNQSACHVFICSISLVCESIICWAKALISARSDLVRANLAISRLA